MTFLPIVERELRLAARRTSTYGTRFWAAFVFVAICLGMLIATRRSQSPAALGRMMFTVLTWITFACCLMAGVRFTADSLSEEKREGTLGFLFLTNLRGYDVVLGKLVVTSLNSLYALLAVLPLLGLPLLLGGVTGTEFWRMILVLVNTLFFSLALGILVSAIGREERQVTLQTLFLLLAITFALPSVWKGATALTNQRWWDLLFLLPSPAYAFSLAGLPATLPSSRDYVLSMWSIASLSVIFLSLAGWLLPWSFRETSRFGRSRPRRNHWLQWRFGDQSSRRLRGRIARTSNPFLWLLARDRLPKLCIWLFAAFTGAFAIFIFVIIKGKSPGLWQRMVTVFGSYGLHLLLKSLVASEACRRLNEDRRTGALELLLTTPLKIQSILRAQMKSLIGIFRGALVALVFLNLLLIAGINEHEPGRVIFGGIAILVPDFLALSWMGMWMGLKSPRFSHAVVATVARVMLPPFLVLLLVLFAAAGSGASSGFLNTFFFCWFVAAGIYDLALVSWTKRKLGKGFRSAAAQDYCPINSEMKWALPFLKPNLRPHSAIESP